MHELFAQEAINTGIGVLPLGQAQGATSRLIVEVQQYWCDGYPPSFKADAVASAMIIDGSAPPFLGSRRSVTSTETRP